MDIKLSYDSGGNLLLSVDMGRVTVTADKALVDMASAWILKRRIGDDTSVAGFFDSLRAGVAAIKKLSDIPLVRRVVSAIPYGGTVLAAVDVASDAAKLGRKTIAKVVPKKAALVINNALNGDKAAQDALRRAAAKSPAIEQRIRSHIRLIQDVNKLDEFGQAYKQAQSWQGAVQYALGPSIDPAAMAPAA